MPGNGSDSLLTRVTAPDHGGLRHVVVTTATQAGERLDRILADALPTLSRTRIQRLIKDGQVTSGGETITDPSYRVKPGQTFAAVVPDATEVPLRAQAMELAILYEDEHLLVLDKPAGLTVHPGAGRADSTLVNALLAHCGDSLSGIGGVKRPGIVHRLDKDTSGAMVIAKTDAAHASLSRQFAGRSIDRHYLAIVWGVPMPPAGEIEGAIGRHPTQRKKMAVLGHGKGRPARTRYRVKTRFGDRASLLECRLATGRTHQIRVHLAHIGHPLIGDPVYGRRGGAAVKGLSTAEVQLLTAFPRQALHAATIGFDHPASGERLTFESPIPSDMRHLISSLDTLREAGEC